MLGPTSTFAKTLAIAHVCKTNIQKLLVTIARLNVEPKIDRIEKLNTWMPSKNAQIKIERERKTTQIAGLQCVAVASEIFEWFYDVRAQHWLTDEIFISHDIYTCDRAHTYPRVSVRVTGIHRNMFQIFFIHTCGGLVRFAAIVLSGLSLSCLYHSLQYTEPYNFVFQQFQAEWNAGIWRNQNKKWRKIIKTRNVNSACYHCARQLCHTKGEYFYCVFETW